MTQNGWGGWVWERKWLPTCVNGWGLRVPRRRRGFLLIELYFSLVWFFPAKWLAPKIKKVRVCWPWCVRSWKGGNCVSWRGLHWGGTCLRSIHIQKYTKIIYCTSVFSMLESAYFPFLIRSSILSCSAERTTFFWLSSSLMVRHHWGFSCFLMNSSI